MSQDILEEAKVYLEEPHNHSIRSVGIIQRLISEVERCRETAKGIADTVYMKEIDSLTKERDQWKAWRDYWFQQTQDEIEKRKKLEAERDGLKECFKDSGDYSHVQERLIKNLEAENGELKAKLASVIQAIKESGPHR